MSQRSKGCVHLTPWKNGFLGIILVKFDIFGGGGENFCHYLFLYYKSVYQISFEKYHQHLLRLTVPSIQLLFIVTPGDY